MPDNSHIQPQILDGLIGNDTEEWIKENWKQLHCYAMEAASAAFWMGTAVKNSEPGPGAVLSWAAIGKAAEAAAGFVGCAFQAPTAEETYGESELQCQCANQGGQLIAAVDAGLGALALELKSGPEEAKEIIDVTDTAEASICKYKTTTGSELTAQALKKDIYETFNVEWYIRPMPGTGCCGDLPMPPVIDPPPPGVEKEYDPIPGYNRCRASWRIDDVYIDNNGMLWYRMVVCQNCPPYDNKCVSYWESIYGPEWHDSVRDPKFPHPPVPKSCNISGLSQVRYSVSAGCTWNEEEEKYDTVYHADVNETDDGILGLAWRLDAIAWLLEKVNLIPYGICDECSKPKLAPHWRSVRFESEKYTDRGNRRLDKLLRYRGAEPGDIDFLAEYWNDFEWTTGPVCVYHKGSPVGTPQVWADSEDEGKRVLRHAFREAGFDADQVGEWGVSGSSDPRYGVRLKVKLKVVDGCWSATSRPSPGGWPEAGIVLPDP